MLDTDAAALHGLWDDLGVEPGMAVNCHSFLPALGRLVPGPEVVVDTLLERLGSRGSLIVPTFTYSYFEGKVYDVQRSPSTVGALGDLVRTRPGSVRSLDPNFSMAAIGGDAHALMRRETPHSFGAGTVYERLMRAGMHVLLLGVDFTALALFMHLEKVHEVHYRYDKFFSGTTRHGDHTFEDTAVHFVRDEHLEPESYRSRVGDVIDRQPDCRRVALAYGEHRFVPAATVARVVAESLVRDPYFLIEKPVGPAAER